MEEETVTLPKAPEGYEYRLMKKPSVRYKDPSTLTSNQRTALQYRDKNTEQMEESNRQSREKKKENGKKCRSTYGQKTIIKS